MDGETLFLWATAVATVAFGAGAFLFLWRFGGARAGAASVALGNLLVLATLLSALGLALEGYYRLVYDETDSWNRSRVSRRWFDRHWQLNANGVRDDVDYPLRRDPERRRITFLGDSFTTGHGVADVGDRFTNRIRRARPGWEVHAIARNGLNTVEEIEELRRFTDEGYELDVVVLVFCHNDIDTYIPEFQELYRRLFPPPGWLSPLLARSDAADFYFQRYVQWQVGRERPYADLRRAAWAGRPWTLMADTLELAAENARERGARFAVVTFPWMRLLLAGETEPRMHAVLDRFWRERGIPHLDLLPLFREHDPADLVVSRRDTHPNERAHALAAEAIVRFLEAEVL